MSAEAGRTADRRTLPARSTDFLTGFFLRGAFSQLFQRELRRSSRETTPLSVILIDIDHFKTVNDSFGHTRGDQVLRDFAQRLSSSVRSSDLVFRYGGDEFVILLPGTPMEGARTLAGTIMDRVSLLRFPGDPELSITISMGLAAYPVDGSMPEDIFEKADSRLYQAKRQGRGRISHADEAGQSGEQEEDSCRLLERDSELDSARVFLRELPGYGKGILVITGSPRTGKKSLAEAITCMAELSGMSVLRIDPFALDSGLRGMAPSDSGSGLMVMLDGAGHLGDGDLQRIRSCVSSFPETVAVVLVGTDLSSEGWGMVAGFPLSEVLHLGPISFPAARIWLRGAMGVEPSREFAGWFYSETGGLPGNFQPAFRYLERRGYLTRNATVRTPASRYWEFDLSRELTFEAGYRIRNLPRGFATSFIGRRVVTASVIEHLRSGQSVCIAGPGGSGKTRAALNAASLIEDEFRNGVCFVALSSLPAQEPVLPALIAALDLRTADGEEALSQVCSFLAEKEMLVILDGFEGGDGSARVLETIREASIGVRFLITSRSRSEIKGVEEVELGGLTVPTGSIDSVGNEAVDLFLQVARRFRTGYEPDSMEMNDISAICRAVEGLPLAIELAASLMDGLSCADIRKSVESDYLSLETDDGTVPERHRSMETVFRQSWNLVPPAQQTCLRKLSVFRGVITTEAAEAVAGADATLLSRLQRRWMVRRTLRGRWLIPRMIRGFLEKELASDPEEYAVAMQAHCSFFSGYLSQMEESLFTMVDWTLNRRELDSALDDIRQAWEWALSRGSTSTLMVMIKPLVLFFRSRGLIDTGIEILEAASRGVMSLKDSGLEDAVSLQALTDVSLGLLLFLKGDLGGASRTIDAAMALPSGSADPWTEGCVLDYAGFVKFRGGEYAEAVERLTRSAQLFEEAGRRREYLQARSNLGITLISMGEVEKADAIISATLDECRVAGFRRIEFTCLQAAGRIAMARGEIEVARESFMKYLAYARENGLTAEIAKTLNDLASIAADIRDYDESEQLYHQALKVFTDLGNRNGQAGVDFNLGIIAQMRKRQDVAEEHYNRTLQYAEEAGDRYLELGSQTGLSFVHASRGMYSHAISHLIRAYDIADESGARPQALRALYGISETLLDSGRIPEAAEFFFLFCDDAANDSENVEFIDTLRSRLQEALSPEELAVAEAVAAERGIALFDSLRPPV